MVGVRFSHPLLKARIFAGFFVEKSIIDAIIFSEVESYDFTREGITRPPKRSIIWEAHPNIERNRLLGIGQGRLIDDYDTIEELKMILIGWLY